MVTKLKRMTSTRATYHESVFDTARICYLPPAGSSDRTLVRLSARALVRSLVRPLALARVRPLVRPPDH